MSLLLLRWHCLNLEGHAPSWPSEILNDSGRDGARPSNSKTTTPPIRFYS
jgi:hypothetical protein